MLEWQLAQLLISRQLEAHLSEFYFSFKTKKRTQKILHLFGASLFILLAAVS